MYCLVYYFDINHEQSCRRNSTEIIFPLFIYLDIDTKFTIDLAYIEILRIACYHVTSPIDIAGESAGLNEFLNVNEFDKRLNSQHDAGDRF